ncbi:MAG: PGF-CTERM sorting domain-containing protein [Halobacteriota archaeon]|nr:PGF-CTERM sorting domain-containing protein [Halobacteriota archaeon]
MKRITVAVILSILLFANVEFALASQNNTTVNTTDAFLTNLLDTSKYCNIPSRNGKVHKDVIINSSDNKAILTIPSGTVPSSSAGNTLLKLELDAIELGTVAAFNPQPDGAKFAPPVHLSITYDPSKIPSGASESGLLIKMFEDKRWVPIETTIDTSKHSASAEITHLTVFAVIADKSAVDTTPASTTSTTSTASTSSTTTPASTAQKAKETPPEPKKPEVELKPAVWGDDASSESLSDEEEEVEETPGFEAIMAISAIAVSFLLIKIRKRSR